MRERFRNEPDIEERARVSRLVSSGLRGGLSGADEPKHLGGYFRLSTMRTALDLSAVMSVERLRSYALYCADGLSRHGLGATGY